MNYHIDFSKELGDEQLEILKLLIEQHLSQPDKNKLERWDRISSYFIKFNS